MGLYNHHKTVDTSTPAVVPCSDMCGVVTALGAGVSDWKVGDRVISTFLQDHQTGQVKGPMMASGLGLPLEGVLQTHRVFSAANVVKAPTHLSDEETACLPIAAVTAWMAINQFRPLGQPGGKGEVVVLQGTGGVSISGLQIAHAAGAKSAYRRPCKISTHSLIRFISHRDILVGCEAGKGQGSRSRPRCQLPHDS